MTQKLLPLPQKDLSLWVTCHLLSLPPSQLGCPALGWEHPQGGSTKLPSLPLASWTITLVKYIFYIFFCLKQQTIIFFSLLISFSLPALQTVNINRKSLRGPRILTVKTMACELTGGEGAYPNKYGCFRRV